LIEGLVPTLSISSAAPYEEVVMRNWNLGWERTQWPGVYVRGDACRIRARVVDPRSGRLREANRIVHGVTPEQALVQRQTMREELEEVA
jgi:hypothetical protein